MNPYEQRRRRVLDQLQFGEMMVLYSGESVASSMDGALNLRRTIIFLSDGSAP